MTCFFSWYLFITLLGWLTFPLAYRLFPALADRGYTLARAAGLLLWGFLFWWMASLGIVMNDLGGLLLALSIVAGLSVWAFATGDRGPQTVDASSTVRHSSSVSIWLRENWKVILTTEILFLAAFAFLAFVRAANPEILGTEKPMELAFINAILRSPTFPPHDPWLSGYAISYYYFGYVLTAMLARITDVPGTAAFNLMIALVFALGAIGAYGILYNLLAAHNATSKADYQSPITALLAPLFLLLVSNVEGFLEILHRRGLFWTFNADGSATSPFWAWLDMKELSQPPSLPLGGIPERFWWWWRASRVIQDYNLQKGFQEVIDEFPAFSFVLGDLHPHVLAIPFGLLVVAVALHIYLGGWRGSIQFLGARLRISPLGLGVAALVLGGLAFLNIWDILFAATLMILAYLLFLVREDGWSWARLEDALLFGLPLVASALLLYLPFYLGFSSQAGGLLPNLVTPTRGAHLWVMFGTLFLPLFAYLIHLAFTSPRANWRVALTLTLSLTLGLWGISWLVGFAATFLRPDVAQSYLLTQGVEDTTALFAAAGKLRLQYIGGLLTLMALLFPVLAFFFGRSQIEETESSDLQPSTRQPANLQPMPFIILLILLGILLVMGPEFLFLQDQFGSRMNTIFKFYYQAWMLWSLAASFGVVILFKKMRGVISSFAFIVLFALLLLIGLAYPVMAFTTRTNNFAPTNGFSLDDFDRVLRENPDEAAAIQFLAKAGDGVVAEASIVGASYTGYSRVSTYSGLPSVLGWPMHEGQWRGTYTPQGNRQDDLTALYTTPDWITAQQIIAMYHIRYIYIGGLERSTYPVNEDKFYANLPIIFQNGSVTIYEAPQPETENR
jgi:YYY domain-containing protein